MLCCRVVTTNDAGDTIGCQAPLLAAALSAGPDSCEQRQLFCVMISMLKVLRAQVGGQHIATIRASGGLGMFDLNKCFTAVLLVTYYLLVASATAQHAPVSGCDPATFLPWLVLLGRCCVHTAAVISGGPSSPQAAGVAAAGQSAGSQGAAGQQGEFQATLCSEFSDMLRLVHGWLLGLNSPLTDLDVAGYKASDLMQPLENTVHCLDSLAQCPDSEVSAGVVEQLQGLGLALCNQAVPLCCNNPHYTNLSGPSELQLVNGRACMCGGCRVARYCSRACLKQHWKQHKPVCQSLAAAKAAAA